MIPVPGKIINPVILRDFDFVLLNIN